MSDNIIERYRQIEAAKNLQKKKEEEQQEAKVLIARQNFEFAKKAKAVFQETGIDVVMRHIGLGRESHFEYFPLVILWKFLLEDDRYHKYGYVESPAYAHGDAILESCGYHLYGKTREEREEIKRTKDLITVRDVTHKYSLRVDYSNDGSLVFQSGLGSISLPEDQWSGNEELIARHLEDAHEHPEIETEEAIYDIPVRPPPTLLFPELHGFP